MTAKDWLELGSCLVMTDDGHVDRQIVVAYRWTDSGRQSDGLVELSHRWVGSDRWSDRQGKMAYRWSDDVRWSDGLNTGQMGGLMERLVT